MPRLATVPLLTIPGSIVIWAIQRTNQSPISFEYLVGFNIIIGLLCVSIDFGYDYFKKKIEKRKTLHSQ